MNRCIELVGSFVIQLTGQVSSRRLTFRLWRIQEYVNRGKKMGEEGYVT